VIGEIFRLILIEPMINLLIVLNNILFDSTGLAIIAFTILVRLAMFPLTLRQLHHTKALQQLQPRIQELNKKYSDPKRRQEEMMKVYREAGANPIGCLGPMLIQLPILFALFIAIRRTLRVSRGPRAAPQLPVRLEHVQNAVPSGTTSSAGPEGERQSHHGRPRRCDELGSDEDDRGHLHRPARDAAAADDGAAMPLMFAWFAHVPERREPLLGGELGDRHRPEHHDLRPATLRHPAGL
jgi:hypothetical protein